MREAALMIAALGDDYAPTLAARAVALFGRGTALLRRHLAARRAMGTLRDLDERLLDDLGLVPADLADLDRAPTALGATALLAARAEARRRTIQAEDRWLHATLR